MRDAAHFGFAVAHGVEALALAREFARFQFADAARLAEIDVTSEFAKDKDIQTRDHFRPQRRSAGQLGVDHRRPQIGEKPQLLAQAKDRLLRALVTRDGIVTRIAHRPEENGIGGLGQVQRRPRQRFAASFVCRSANRRLLHLQTKAKRAQHLQRLGHNLLADTVAGQHRDFHDLHPQKQKDRGSFQNPGHSLFYQVNSQGCSILRLSSNARITAAWRRVRPMSSKPFNRQYLLKGSMSK